MKRKSEPLLALGLRYIRFGAEVAERVTPVQDFVAGEGDR